MITKKRLLEPSNFAGLALIVSGLGDLFKINEAPAIADGVAQAGQIVAQEPSWSGLLMGAMGAFALFLKERGE